MSVFAEFCLVAVAIYLWESLLWLPLRSVALRRTRRGWKALSPGSLVRMREIGAVWLPPLWTDFHLAPCQAPPLAVAPDGRWLMAASDGRWVGIPAPSWDDLIWHHRHLVVGGRPTRLSSPRGLERLRRAKRRGLSPAQAVRLDWKLSLAPARAAREWRRWSLVAGWFGGLPLLLTWGFLVGLPAAYVFLGIGRTLLLALALWLMMAVIAGVCWWLGRVFPEARGALRTDALLALLVPFHAMRVREIAAVHAFGGTHPAALLLATGAGGHPWLAAWVRGILHPRPGHREDAVFAAAVTAPLAAALARAGLGMAAMDTPAAVPDEDAHAVAYCPRCHSRFTPGVSACADCGGMVLRPLPAARRTPREH